MSKPKNPTPPSAGAASTPDTPPTYRNNPEVDARIDEYIKTNPRYWAHVQGMPRERLERTIVLNELRDADRRQRMRDGVLKRINNDPKLKQAYEQLVKDLPEDQRDAAITQIARQQQRVTAQAQHQPPRQDQAKAIGV